MQFLKVEKIDKLYRDFIYLAKKTMNKFLQGLFAVIGIALVVMLYVICTKINDNKIGRFASHGGGILDTTNGDLYFYDNGEYLKISNGKETNVKKIQN